MITDKMIEDVARSIEHVWWNSRITELADISIRFRLCAKAALEAAEKTKWQPIDTAPRDGREILVYYPEVKEIEKVYWEKKNSRFETMRSVIELNPTHWQPLPTPPEGENNG